MRHPDSPRQTVEMTASARKRGLKATAVCLAAGLLFFVSLATVSTVFFIWHVLATRPRHDIPFHFEYAPGLQNLRPALQAYADLSGVRGLRSVQEMNVGVHLVVPESRANLENSVFYISAEVRGRSGAEDRELITKEPEDKDGDHGLFRTSDLRLAQGSGQAVLRFRSPAHRTIRAVVLFLPLLVGAIKEYQKVDVPLLNYNALHSFGDGPSPQIDGIHLQLFPADVQISKAVLNVRVVRRPFVSAMVGEQRISTFILMAIVMWYMMLLALVASIAALTAVRRLAGRVWRTVLRRGSGSSQASQASQASQTSQSQIIFSLPTREEYRRHRESISLPPLCTGPGTPPGKLVRDTSRSPASSVDREGLRRRESSACRGME